MKHEQRTEPDDGALLDAFLSDPEGVSGRRAVSELFGRYQRRVYLWCYRYVRDRERALELAQDAFARAWRALPSFGRRSRFSWWLFVIARNVSLNAVAAPSLLRGDAALLDGVPSVAPGPAERFEQEQDWEAARRLMLDHLDDQERMALWRCCYERMPLDGITRVLGLENATGARGLLQRARRKLRAALEAREE